MRGRGLIGTDEVRRKWKVWEFVDWMWLAGRSVCRSTGW